MDTFSKRENELNHLTCASMLCETHEQECQLSEALASLITRVTQNKYVCIATDAEQVRAMLTADTSDWSKLPAKTPSKGGHHECHPESA